MKFLCVFSCDVSLCFSSQEAAWTISNITAGQPHQIQCVVDAGLIPGVIDIMIKVNQQSAKKINQIYLIIQSIGYQMKTKIHPYNTKDSLFDQ